MAEISNSTTEDSAAEMAIISKESLTAEAVRCVNVYVEHAEVVDCSPVAQFASAALLFERQRQSRRIWVRELLIPRNQFGEFHHLVRDMRHGDGRDLFEYFRMSKERYGHILSLVSPLIERQNKSFRQSISPAERLTFTLRYLAHGSSQRICAKNYRIGKLTASGIILDTCNAIWNALQPIYLPAPSKKTLNKIAEDFSTLWNFPNCIGALDEKHATIQAPPKCGSVFYNYKGTHSIVLLATCDASYKFTMTDVGECGSRSDGGIFRNSEISDLLKDDDKLPEAKNLPHTSVSMPCVIVGDETFPLTNHLMRPYPGKQLPLSCKIFNYRLSRARRIIENAFGILSSRWRIYRQPIIGSLETVNAIVYATVCLHNFLRTCDEVQGRQVYCPPGYPDHEDVSGKVHPGKWRQGVSESDALRDMQKRPAQTCTPGLQKNFVIQSPNTSARQPANFHGSIR